MCDGMRWNRLGEKFARPSIHANGEGAEAIHLRRSAPHLFVIATYSGMAKAGGSLKSGELLSCCALFYGIAKDLGTISDSDLFAHVTRGLKIR
jgi:hypothetical protein